MRKALRRMREQEEGFGIVEVLVAMTIMAIVLMTLAPFLISSFATTARNVRIAAATELVNQRVDVAKSRANTNSCVAFEKFLVDHLGVPDGPNRVVDAKRKITFQLAMATDFTTSAACEADVNAGVARTYYLRVEVADQKDAKLLASAKTWVAVPGFGA